MIDELVSQCTNLDGSFDHAKFARLMAAPMAPPPALPSPSQLAPSSGEKGGATAALTKQADGADVHIYERDAGRQRSGGER